MLKESSRMNSALVGKRVEYSNYTLFTYNPIYIRKLFSIKQFVYYSKYIIQKYNRKCQNLTLECRACGSQVAESPLFSYRLLRHSYDRNLLLIRCRFLFESSDDKRFSG